MTDPVNVPRERIEAFLDEWPNRSGNGNIIYSLGLDDGYCELTVSDLRAMLAAAPKAEPVARSAEYRPEREDFLNPAIGRQYEAQKVEQEPCYECGSTTFISTADIHRACATCNPELLPAPASDELLEALRFAGRWREAPAWDVGSAAFSAIRELDRRANGLSASFRDGEQYEAGCRVLDVVADVLAKHKGPQS